MPVDAGDHRNVGANDCPHPAQQLPFAVVMRLGHHGPVQIQIDAMERSILVDGQLQLPDDCAGDRLERLIRDLGAWACRCPGQWHDRKTGQL